MAREVYLRKNDRFTVEKIIDIALRQDIGPDPSYSRVRDNAIINEKGAAELMKYIQHPNLATYNPDKLDISIQVPTTQTSIQQSQDYMTNLNPTNHFDISISQSTDMKELKPIKDVLRNMIFIGEM